MYSRETLKPNSSGESCNNFLNKVLLPEPDGPAITSGRGNGYFFDAISVIYTYTHTS